MNYTNKTIMRYMKLSLRYGILALLMINIIPLSAQTTQGITTGVPFLRIAPDARAGSMGNLGVVTSADAYAPFYNNSKTIFSQGKGEIGATYTPWLRKMTNDIFLASLSGYYKLDDEQALTGAVRFFNMGSMTVTDYNGIKQSSYRPIEYSIDFGYARRLSKQLAAGASFRYIYSKISIGANNGVSYSAGNAFAADLSLTYNALKETGEGWVTGAAVTNLGSKIGYTNNNDNYFLPANIAIGTAYTGVIDEENKITVGVEINKSLVPKTPVDATAGNMDDYYNKTSVFSSWGKSFSNNALASSIGAEYCYNSLLFVRAGYNAETTGMGGRNYFTAGTGINYESVKFDFAYLAAGSTNPLANTMRFSIAWQPDCNKKKK